MYGTEMFDEMPIGAAMIVTTAPNEPRRRCPARHCWHPAPTAAGSPPSSTSMVGARATRERDVCRVSPPDSPEVGGPCTEVVAPVFGRLSTSPRSHLRSDLLAGPLGGALLCNGSRWPWSRGRSAPCGADRGLARLGRRRPRTGWDRQDEPARRDGAGQPWRWPAGDLSGCPRCRVLRGRAAAVHERCQRPAAVLPVDGTAAAPLDGWSGPSSSRHARRSAHGRRGPRGARGGLVVGPGLASAGQRAPTHGWTTPTAAICCSGSG